MTRSKIAALIQDAISQGVFPGAVVLCALDQKIIFHEAFGLADIFESRKMQVDSIFDLASLTKPLATTLAVAKLIQDGRLSLDRNIGTILDAFKYTEKKDITIDMLLRHTSGFPAHREYFKKMVKAGKPRQTLRQLLVQEPLETKIDGHPVYSDLGFMILSWIVEKISNERLDQFVSRQVYAPLDIDHLFFIPVNCAAENDFLDRQKIVSTQDCPWRKKVLNGQVDDDNAWAAGGIEGHAGLFGDAFCIYKLCCEILRAMTDQPTRVLAPDILKQFVQKKHPCDRVAGFDTPSKKNSSSGHFFSDRSIGHLGFTGTSFWIDPETDLIIVFLTNRVHPFRSNNKIRKFRPQLHDLIYTELM